MNISIHYWPPEQRGGQQTSPEIGILAIDDESGHAVACISERSQQANITLAKRRLRSVVDNDGERKEMQLKIDGLQMRLAACNRTIDDLDTLDAYRQNELHEERAARQLSDRDNQRLIKRIDELRDGLRALRTNGIDFRLVAKLLREP